MSEDDKRFYQRNLTRKGNYSLNLAAKDAGVKNFDKFHNFGWDYMVEKQQMILLKEKKLR